MAVSTLIFYAQFTASKAGKTGLAATIDVKSVNRATGAVAAVQSGAAMTDLGWRGLYFYRLVAADPRTYDYVAAAVTADATVDLKEVPALWSEFSPSAFTGLPDAAPGGNNGVPTADANNAVKANLLYALGTLLTEASPGQIAAAIKAMFDTAAPVTPSGGRLPTSITLTQAAALVPGATVGDAGAVAFTRGNTVVMQITGLGSLAGRSKLYFTVKKNPLTEGDAQSILQVEETAGLLYLARAAATDAALANLAVDDVDAGNVTITLAAGAAALIRPDTYNYDVKLVAAGDGSATSRAAGAITVSADVTRATS